VLRVANGLKWCNKWRCVGLVTLLRRLTTYMSSHFFQREKKSKIFAATRH
jgi:hypothetical protein